MSTSIEKVKIRGLRENEAKDRSLVNSTLGRIDNTIIITVENKYLTGDYQEQIPVDTDLVDLINVGVLLGMQVGQLQGKDLFGTTSYFLNIDNLTVIVMEKMITVKDKINVELLGNKNLYFETEFPEDFIETDVTIVYSKDYTKGLVKLNGSSWDEIASIENLFWDKYAKAKLVSNDYIPYSREDFLGMTVDELEQFILDYEVSTRDDIVVSGYLKADYQNAVLAKLGV